nr:zinc-binding dehydrogenase [Mycobacterium sp. URHB0044]
MTRSAHSELPRLEPWPVAVLPDAVEFADAVALPVAGVTALQALGALGPVVGRRVLITGASGGVGRFTVQLAARAGAHGLVGDGGSKSMVVGWLERNRGARKRLDPFIVRAPFSADLDYLVELLAAGQLDPQIGLRDSWDNVTAAAEALLGRRVQGKAVLDVS